ncbi:MAG: PLD nuclease N-terminal domain-containing protein [Rhodococcus sp. (in: high G+C Gram-positive bacteria)]|nr:PLD nuclease N-terminal domain-containing protein [Rhodococcus sp. (in: high G+C Gram-positive bacteria)]
MAFWNAAPAGGAIALVLFIVALLSIARESSLSGLAKIAWSLVAFILPIIGPILWFAIGKRYPYGVSGGNR